MRIQTREYAGIQNGRPVHTEWTDADDGQALIAETVAAGVSREYIDSNLGNGGSVTLGNSCRSTREMRDADAVRPAPDVAASSASPTCTVCRRAGRRFTTAPAHLSICDACL